MTTNVKDYLVIVSLGLDNDCFKMRHKIVDWIIGVNIKLMENTVGLRRFLVLGFCKEQSARTNCIIFGN